MSRSRAARVLFVNGPSLNVLGSREPDTYGLKTLAQIEADVSRAARREGVRVEFFQSNHEGEIVERLQGARGKFDGLVINPAAYTHTSVAIRDALIYSEVPAVEVHLSNPERREAFRRTSTVGDVVVGKVTGFGAHGYVLALLAIINHIRESGEGARS